MKYDCYKRFLESDDYHECVRHEMIGKELPEGKENKQTNMFSWKNLRPRLSLTVSTKKKKVPNQTRFYEPDKCVARRSTAITPVKVEELPKVVAQVNTNTRQKLKYLSQSEVNVARNSFCGSTPNMSPSSNFRNEMLLKRLLLNGRSLDFSDDKNSDAFFSDLMSGSQCAPPLTTNCKTFFPYLSQPNVSTQPDNFSVENEGTSNHLGHLKIDSKTPKRNPSLVRFNISPVANRLAFRLNDSANKLPNLHEKKFTSRIPVKKAIAPPPVPPKFKHPFPPPPPRQSRPRTVRMANEKMKSVYV